MNHSNATADKLSADEINSLPPPIIARFVGGHEWPVYDIDVQTGLMRIDVCGKLDIKHFGEVKFLRDAEDIEHEPPATWALRWLRRCWLRLIELNATSETLETKPEIKTI